MKHTSLTCPWILTSERNAAAAAVAGDTGTKAQPSVDLRGVSPNLRAAVAGCVGNLASVSISSGGAVSSSETLAELTAKLGSEDITFLTYKTLLMTKMAATKDGGEITQIAALIAAGAAGAPVYRAEAPVSQGLPVVGVRERILNALLRKATADHKHLGNPSAAASHVMRVGTDGVPFYEVDADEAIHTYPMFMLVMEWVRHAYLGVGLASEHAIHFFLSWLTQRLMVGDTMLVVQRTMRLLIRIVDTGTRDWVSAVEQDGSLTLDLVRSAQRTVSSSGSFPTNYDTKPHTKSAPGGAKEEEAAAGEKLAPASERPCKRFNSVDPERADTSLPCLFRKKNGACKYAHICSKPTAGGGMCGGSHPEWEHKDMRSLD